MLENWNKYVVLGLGTNVGNPSENLEMGRMGLEKIGFSTISVSSHYQSNAVGFTEQNDFINIILVGNFNSSSRELLHGIHQLEKEMGRVRKKKWGPRVIDIDIINFYKEESQDPFLSLPHPRWNERLFVLKPIRELFSNFLVPGTNKYLDETIQWLEKNTDQEIWKIE